MNCISASILISSLIACSACGAPVPETETGDVSADYSLHYSVTPLVEDQSVLVSLELSQSHRQLREMSFSNTQIVDLHQPGSDDTKVVGERVVWHPSDTGGVLEWRVTLNHERNDKGFDAWLGTNWGIFRAEDIIPRAATRTVKGATSRTTLSFELPSKWSAVTEYPGNPDNFDVDRPARRFDQPSGWIAIGQLGVRRETIAGTYVTVVAPEGQAVRRMDMLALLNWTLPELGKILQEPLPRLTIFSAAEPMWRGGLSAPTSIFIHADRPLISENATSTLVHEVMHVALRIIAGDGYDWITEGLAEYYSLELLLRGGAITARRYGLAIEDQADWAKQSGDLCGPRSSGPTTAFAVGVFRKLDEEIRDATAGRSGLDTVVAHLARSDSIIDLEFLARVAADVSGKPSRALKIDNLPGCRTLATQDRVE